MEERGDNIDNNTRMEESQGKWLFYKLKVVFFVVIIIGCVIWYFTLESPLPRYKIVWWLCLLGCILFVKRY